MDDVVTGTLTDASLDAVSESNNESSDVSVACWIGKLPEYE